MLPTSSQAAKVQRFSVNSAVPQRWVGHTTTTGHLVKSARAPLCRVAQDKTQNVAEAVAAPAVETAAPVKESSAKTEIKDLVVGDTYEGTVKSVAAYGCFVDIGTTTDGLCHISELSHGYVRDVGDVVSAGQKISVVLIKMEGEKLSLSIKQTQPKPDQQDRQQNTRRAPRRGREPAAPRHDLKVGDTVTGFARTVPFGAFIKVKDGFEVLLPTSEMRGAADMLDPNPRNLIQENTEVTATVIKVDGNKVAVTNMSPEERESMQGADEDSATESQVLKSLGGSLVNSLSSLSEDGGIESLLASLPSKPSAPAQQPAAVQEPVAEAEPAAATEAAPAEAAPAEEEGVKISAAMVKELRTLSGAGMMDCKNALLESGGDLAGAQEALRQKGLASAEKKAGRIAAEGAIASYIHAGSRLGVMVEVNCETDFVARGDMFKEFASDIAMQVAACPDVKVVSPDDVPQDVLAKEKETELAKEDLMNKPEQVREKIVEGRLNKFKNQQALLEQAFIRSENSETVDTILKQKIAETGEKISIRRFMRYDLGEGLEKKSDDFAAEVAAQTVKKEEEPKAEAPKEEKPEEKAPAVKVDAKSVKALRDSSGAGMMDCKRALVESNNDVEAATAWLKTKGLASASKKAGRIAAEGVIETYIHTGASLGILIEVNCETDFVAKGDMFKELAGNMAMQVAANPDVLYVSPEDVPQSFKDAEMAIESKRDDLDGKPEQAKSKIIEGRVNKTVNKMCLLNQDYIRTPDKTVDTVIKEAIASTGENIKVRRFERFNLGEGMEKRQDDFAAEVAAQTGQA